MNLPVFERGKEMAEKDWETAEDYYCAAEDEKDLSLEDFITEGDLEPSATELAHNSNEEFQKTVEEVHKVLALAAEGRSIPDIAVITGLDEKYVYDIQVCAQGFREDDEIAVAYLVRG